MNRAWANRSGCVAAVVLALAGGARAQEADKSGYWLFNPTPRELMREMSADRPDGTESPITVDAGHVQVEASFLDYTYNDDGDERTNAYTVMDTNVKFGLTNNMDLQVIFGAYGEEKTTVPGPDERLSGFSDVTLRLKVNLWGNEGESKTAFGIMPFITIPTGTELSTEEAEGGFIAMLGWDAGENWSLGFMAEIDAVHDADEDNHDVEFVHTAVLGVDVFGPVGAYFEYIGVNSSDSGSQYQAFFSTGLTYAINDDAVLDIGTRLGLTDASDDMVAFTGITFRF